MKGRDWHGGRSASTTSCEQIRSSVYRKERDEWCWLFRAQRLLQRIPIASSGVKRRVTLVREFAGRQKERDVDNLVGGMKAVVDAMVHEHLLSGDDPKHAEIHYAQRRAASEAMAGLHVTIEVLA